MWRCIVCLYNQNHNEVTAQSIDAYTNNTNKGKVSQQFMTAWIPVLILDVVRLKKFWKRHVSKRLASLVQAHSRHMLIRNNTKITKKNIIYSDEFFSEFFWLPQYLFSYNTPLQVWCLWPVSTELKLKMIYFDY